MPITEGGKIEITLTPQPQLFQTVMVKARYVPLHDGYDGRVSLYVDPEIGAQIDLIGIEVLSENIPKLDKVEKDKPIEAQLHANILRPGVWAIRAGLHYRVQGSYWYFQSRKVLFLVVTDKGSTVYDDPIKIPLEMWYIPSKIQIVPPSDKGSVKTEKDKAGYLDIPKMFIAYLTKEPRLDFEPVYPFKFSYRFCCGNPGNFDPVKGPKAPDKRPKESPVWSVQGGIGTITEEGVFTATKFGKGKVCVKHGVLEDCLDVDVVPLPNPSPPDKIVDAVILPYETEKEKKIFSDVASEYKNKKFKTKKEAHDFLLKNHKGPKVWFYRFKVKEDELEDVVVENGKLLFGKTFPVKGKTIREEERYKKTITLGQSLTFFAFGITASGGITDRKTSSDDWGLGVGKMGGKMKRTDKETGITHLAEGLIFDYGEFTFTPEEIGVYHVGDCIVVVE